MSHFSVLVVGDVQQQLRAFQENNMGDCPKELMEFNDVTEEKAGDYEEDTADVVVGPRGKIYSLYDEKFRNPDWQAKERHLIPKGYTQKTIPVKEFYPDFDLYMTKYCGYKKDPDTGKYGYWENPNAKWDWYVIGGRYQGRLNVKGETESVDAAKVSDVDWDAMRAARREGRKEQWDEAHSKDKDYAEVLYGIKPGTTEEEYVNGGEFSCFAVVKDGKWYEKGTMGWWGTVSGAMADGEWEKQLRELLAGLKPDDVISVVDCHI